MPSLREIQAAFAAALLDAGCARNAPSIRADGISPEQRLAFYRTNVFENYRKALSATYPATERLVGTACFARLAREYSTRFWSRSGDVGAHGERFPDFLAAHPIARQLPYLQDLARLEWAIEECFYESDRLPLDLQRLAAVPATLTAVLRFQLAPSVRLLGSAFPLLRIWQMSMSADTDAEEVHLSEGGVRLLVHRVAFAVQVEAVGEAELAMLRALHTGYGFGEAFDCAYALDAGFDAAAFLQKHVASGLVCDFALAAEVNAPLLGSGDQRLNAA